MTAWRPERRGAGLVALLFLVAGCIGGATEQPGRTGGSEGEGAAEGEGEGQGEGAAEGEGEGAAEGEGEGQQGEGAAEGEGKGEGEGELESWPNTQSSTNGDAWLRQHHQELRLLRPRLLVLDFVDVATTQRVQTLIDRLLAAFAEASRPLGAEDAGAEAQLRYQLVGGQVVDLRDGVLGRPAAPPGWTYENSTLYPRRPPEQAGSWRFDYAALFGAEFAPRYGIADPAHPGRFLTLCELIDGGLINELWIVASGDVPDAGAAEVLESKQRYDDGGDPVPGSFERCAGNGCFDDDVPGCARSVRIGFVNYNRGPGCYLESHGHGMEGLGRSGAIPAFSEWLVPFVRFDLRRRYGLPFDSLYAMGCPAEPCVSYPAPDAALFVLGPGAAQTWRVQPWDAACGNVHFPPNGQRNYDLDNATEVLASCRGFGRHEGAGGADRVRPVSADSWSRYRQLAQDCMGPFLVWWYQGMPGHASGQTFGDGRPMPAAWPFLFY